MTRKWSLFTKMVTFLALLLLAIAGLYGYTVATSIDTVQQELETSRLNQLKFLADMLENDIDQLTLNAYNLLQDQSVRDYAILPSIEHLVDRNRLKMTILEKLKLQSTASAWTNTLTVYYPETGDVLSSDPIRALKVEYDFNELQPDRWTFDHLTGEFILYVRDREAGGDVSVVLSFSSENIRKLLASYKSNSRPYLYHPSGRFIFDYNMDSVTAIRMAGQLQRHGHIFQRRHVGDEVERLEHDADRPAAKGGHGVLRQLVGPLSCDPHLAGIDPFQARHHHQQCGLARPGWPHDRRRMATFHLQGYTSQDLNGGRALAKPQGHVFQFNDVCFHRVGFLYGERCAVSSIWCRLHGQ